MPVQDDAHPERAGVVDDLVQDLQRREPDEVRVRVGVDARRDRAGLERITGVRHPDRVVAQLGHVVDHRLPRDARPQAVERLVVRLHAEPVDPGQAHGRTRGVDDLVALGAEVAGPGAARRRRDGAALRRRDHGGDGEREDREASRACGRAVWSRARPRACHECSWEDGGVPPPRVRAARDGASSSRRPDGHGVRGEERPVASHASTGGDVPRRAKRFFLYRYTRPTSSCPTP